MSQINGLEVRNGQVYEPALGVPTQAIPAPDGKSIALVRAAVLYGPNGEPVAGRPGASQPSQAVLIGGSDGSNLQALSVIPNNTAVPATYQVVMIGGNSDGYAEAIDLLPQPIGNDGLASSSFFGPYTSTGMLGYNGTSWDRARVIPGATGVLATPYSGTKNLALTASAEVKATPGVIGTFVNTGTTTSPTITVYDNTAASGTVVWSGTLAAGQVLPLGMPCGVGIYVALSAAGTITLSYA